MQFLRLCIFFENSSEETHEQTRREKVSLLFVDLHRIRSCQNLAPDAHVADFTGCRSMSLKSTKNTLMVSRCCCFRAKTVCEVCGQSVLDVKAHVARMHSETKPAGKMYMCPVCGRQTRDVSYFRFHMMAKHNDTSYGSVKVYKCDQCDYQNHSRYVISKHKRLVHGTLNFSLWRARVCVCERVCGDGGVS